MSGLDSNWAQRSLAWPQYVRGLSKRSPHAASDGAARAVSWRAVEPVTFNESVADILRHDGR